MVSTVTVNCAALSQKSCTEEEEEEQWGFQIPGLLEQLEGVDSSGMLYRKVQRGLGGGDSVWYVISPLLFFVKVN